MAKETCNSCSARLAHPVSFCPSCDRPTRHASDAERLEWDLKQWRAHVDRSVAAGMNPNGTAVGFGTGAAVVTAEREPEPEIRTEPVPQPRIAPAPAEPDYDHEFAYERCATCNERDWIVRYGKNDDETYKYWCVRCSRSFKTEVKLGYAVKPFLSSGVALGSITAASLLLLR